jgi:hypothetical protein
MHMRVAYAKTAGEGFETGVGHFIDIADRAVDDGAHAAEGAVHVAVHLTPEGADRARLVEILHADDLGTRNAGDVATVFVPAVGIGLAMRLVARLDDHGDSVTDHWPHLWHEVAGFFEVEGIRGRIALGDLLPAVVDGGGVPALELEEVGVREHGIGNDETRRSRISPWSNAMTRA